MNDEEVGIFDDSDDEEQKNQEHSVNTTSGFGIPVAHSTSIKMVEGQLLNNNNKQASEGKGKSGKSLKSGSTQTRPSSSMTY